MLDEHSSRPDAVKSEIPPWSLFSKRGKCWLLDRAHAQRVVHRRDQLVDRHLTVAVAVAAAARPGAGGGERRLDDQLGVAAALRLERGEAAHLIGRRQEVERAVAAEHGALREGALKRL